MNLDSKFAVLLIAGVLLSAGCGGKSEGNIAIVNGEAITSEEFNNYLQRKPIVQVLGPRGPSEAQVAAPLGFQALRDMVNRRILTQLAKDDNVYPTSADIEAELSFQTKRRPNFVRDLTDAGMTLTMIKQDLTLDLCRERILSKGVTLTDADVDKYIKENPKAFMDPELADLYWIVLTDKNKIAEVDRQLGAGQPFALVATRFSAQPDARASQGRYPERRVDSMPDRLQKLIRATPEGRQTAWLQDGQNQVKFYVEKKTPGRKIEIDDTIRTLVKRQLAVQRGTQANDLPKRMRDKLKAANITIELVQLRDPWKKAFDSLKEEDAARTATGTATGATGQ
ncbi:MAG: SurA N-terminal domain-containing protein [Fimbriimonas sp.]